MRIIFPEYLADKGKNVVNITEGDIIYSVNHPLQRQKLEIDGLTLLLFLSKKENAEKFLLTVGEYSNNEYVVRQCLRLRPELVEKAGTFEPLILLRQLAENFGLEQKIGQKKAKFFYREFVKINERIKGNSIFSIRVPEETSSFVSGAYYKRSEYGVIELALAFSLDLESYKNWLEERVNVEITPKIYDVFISYKRNTAKDFALHLKQCLADDGYVAFLDLKDIPKEFAGSAKWFNERDQAIRNSKRFLLIMTIMVDTSDEVANELTLARTVPNMKFIYMRHDAIKPQMVLKAANGEIIDLSEGNQETFGNEVDLVRKVFQILEESKDKVA